VRSPLHAYGRRSAADQTVPTAPGQGRCIQSSRLGHSQHCIVRASAGASYGSNASSFRHQARGRDIGMIAPAIESVAETNSFKPGDQFE